MVESFVGFLLFLVGFLLGMPVQRIIDSTKINNEQARADRAVDLLAVRSAGLPVSREARDEMQEALKKQSEEMAALQEYFGNEVGSEPTVVHPDGTKT